LVALATKHKRPRKRDTPMSEKTIPLRLCAVKDGAL
jgi:hypothetical protein